MSHFKSGNYVSSGFMKTRVPDWNAGFLYFRILVANETKKNIEPCQKTKI